jgi:hypothetical protein
MKNITLITSIIDTPNIPLSYTNTRSVFSKNERFEQTKKTIKTIKEKIPNNKIILVEFSKLSNEEETYFKDNVDYFLNIYEIDKSYARLIHSHSKSMGEGIMTIFALNYILLHNIEFDYFYKISGRYWLNEFFNYETYENDLNILLKNKVMHTFFYKLSNKNTHMWLEYLKKSNNYFKNCVGYEVIFGKFVYEMIYLKDYNKISQDLIKTNNKLGISGYVSVCGTYISI